MEAGALLRALKLFKSRAKVSGSFTARCSSSFSSAKILPGKEMGRRAYDGLLLDAANTLLQLTRPVEETYATIGKKYVLNLMELAEFHTVSDPETVTETVECIHVTDMPHTKLTGVQPHLESENACLMHNYMPELIYECMADYARVLSTKFVMNTEHETE
ncbi:putative sphinganine C(4)-monooxygenase 1-like [Capsicum annuum]|nr:putative sphinganine C(4)-monooxygenase 1-like [Capsicum annuum]